MTLGPILPGRIPNSLASLRIRENLNANSNLLLTLQQQIATGQRFFHPGEDPAAAVQTISLQNLHERKTQAQRNTQADTALLAASESVLGELSGYLTSAKSISLAGIGTTFSPTDRANMVVEVESLIRGAVHAANAEFQGRHLFGGSEALTQPFAFTPNGVEFHGDGADLTSYADVGYLFGNNVNPVSAFGSTTTVVGLDLNPALTDATRLSDLHAGTGAALDQIEVTLNDGATTQTAIVDLSGAKTVGDVRTRLAAAFAAGPLTLNVTIDPATNSGLRLAASSGSVAVSNVAGSRTASLLGIQSAAAAVVQGSDLDPQLTRLSTITSLAGGAGIASLADGLQITNGTKSATVDLSGAQTLEDVFNAVALAGIDVKALLTEDGRGIALTSMTAGAPLSIGENGGSLATDLGLRTLTGATRLADLNNGLGVQFLAQPDSTDGIRQFTITRRDGTEATVDITAADTVQDVLNAINAVDPTVLVASLNATGNGISIVDGSGTGPLSVAGNAITEALGIAGTEEGSDPLAALGGADVNPRQASGYFSLLVQLRDALQNEDDRHIGRISNALDAEIQRFNAVRGEVGLRLQVLERVQGRLETEKLSINESLANVFDVDMTEAISTLATKQATLEATMQISATLLRLNLANLLS